MSLSVQLLDPESFTAGTEPNHRALEMLAEILADIGFAVRKKSRKEATLRVYPNTQNKYPLLNPRFTNGRLEITFLSIADNELLDSTLASAREIAGCGFTPMKQTFGDYRYHGVVDISITPEVDLLASLKEVHQLVAKRVLPGARVE